MAPLKDTSPEAEKSLVSVFRRKSIGQKWRLMGETLRDGRLLHTLGVRLRNPSATARDILEDWLHTQLGLTHLPAISEPAPERPMQSMHDLREVFRVFTTFGIPYALGGSMASSIHGIRRDTLDANITVEPFPGKEAQLAAAFGTDYYLSLPAIEQAVRQRSTFNIINTSTGFKVDVFIRKDCPFEQSAMSRRLTVDLPDAPGESLVLHTAEDMILFKLRCYRLGQERATQQWTDVLDIMKVQDGKLDQAYLDHWAADLGVSEPLQCARQESGV
jgi:hypothetical protein